MHFVRFQKFVFIGFFCLFASVCPGQLTQAQIEQAVMEGIASYATYYVGDPTILGYVIPYQDDQMELLSDLLIYGHTSALTAPNILEDRISRRWWPYIQRIGAYSNQLAQISLDLATVSGNVVDWWDHWEAANLQTQNKLSGQLAMMSEFIFDFENQLSAIRGLTNMVSAISNVVDSIADFQSGIRDGSVTVTVDVEAGGIAENVLNNILVQAEAILDLNESYEYQLQLIGATLADLYNLFQDGIYLDDLSDLVASIGSRLDSLSIAVTNDIQVSIPGLENGLAITNWPSTLTETAWWDDMRSLSYARNNTLDNTYSAVTNLTGFASNIMASIVITPQSQREFETHSNAVEQTLSTNVSSDSSSLDASFVSVSNSIGDYDYTFEHDTLYDRFTRNPYDEAHQSSEGLGEAVGDVLSDATSGDFDPEVVIFGSDSRPSASSSSRPDLAVRLPRLVFNLDTMMGRWHSSSLLRSTMILVWMLIGFAFKAMMLKDFLTWYSQREKKV